MGTPIRVGLGAGRQLVDVDPDDLSPRARALAEVWASAPLGWRAHIMLESTRTLREMGAADADSAWYGADALDRPHRISWQSWPTWPEKSRPADQPGDMQLARRARDGVHTAAGIMYRVDDRVYTRVPVWEYLETCAAGLPVGYRPVGLYRDDRVPSADAADVVASVDLIDSRQVLDVLARHGRSLTIGTLRNYTSRPELAPESWPAPVEYVGRTPRWSHPEVVAYARAQQQRA